MTVFRNSSTAWSCSGVRLSNCTRLTYGLAAGGLWWFHRGLEGVGAGVVTWTVLSFSILSRKASVRPSISLVVWQVLEQEFSSFSICFMRSDRDSSVLATYSGLGWGFGAGVMLVRRAATPSRIDSVGSGTVGRLVIIFSSCSNLADSISCSFTTLLLSFSTSAIQVSRLETTLSGLSRRCWALDLSICRLLLVSFSSS